MFDSPKLKHAPKAVLESQIISSDSGEESDGIVIVEPSFAAASAVGASSAACVGKRSRKTASSGTGAVAVAAKRVPKEKFVKHTNKSMGHALHRASSGKYAAIEMAVCIAPKLLASECGQTLAPLLAAENFTVLPPPLGMRRGLVTWHRLSLDVYGIAQVAAAKTAGTLAAASTAAAIADAHRAASAHAATQEAYAAVVWSGEDYLRHLLDEGSDGMEVLVAEIVSKINNVPVDVRCQVVFIVEGLQRALAAVDQRRSDGAASLQRYVTSEAVENAHMHLYLHSSLEVVETSSPAETADHLFTMTKAISEKPYRQKVSSFASVLKKKTKAANFATAGSVVFPKADFGAIDFEAVGDGAAAVGSSCLDTWLGALQMVPSVSEAMAVRIASKYPTLRCLLRAFLDADADRAPFLLEVCVILTVNSFASLAISNFRVITVIQDVLDSRRKLSKLSSIIHAFFTQRSSGD